MLRIVYGLILFFTLLFITPLSHSQEVNLNPVSQEEELVTVTVTRIVSEENFTIDGGKVFRQKLRARVERGILEGKEIELTSSYIPKTASLKYKTGDRLIVGYVPSSFGKNYYYVISYDRTGVLFLITALFIIVVFAVARRQGLMALLGMTVSFLIIFGGILPLISNEYNPILISTLAVLGLVPVTFYIAHGFNKKTSTAILGTCFSLVITILLAKFFIDLANLTGVVNEETQTLIFTKGNRINLNSILLAGIIVAAAGALNDITVSQASIVQQLKKASTKYSFERIYHQAMAVGKDHIASVVNTLILVSIGSSFSMFLLFAEYPRPLLVTLNNEIVAELIISTLIGCIGVIISIPVTTYLACYFFAPKKKS